MKKTICCLAALLAFGLVAAPKGFIEKYDEALQRAEKENKTVFALFTGSDWCPWCVYLEKEVTSQEEFLKEATLLLRYLTPQATSSQAMITSGLPSEHIML